MRRLLSLLPILAGTLMMIGVVLLNGRVHNIWRIDAARLRKAIVEM